MKDERARALLQEERQRLKGLILDRSIEAESDRAASRDTGDIADAAEPLTAEGVDDALVSDLRARLDAIGRAEKRLDDSTYGLSVRSGRPIPDERLEADPAAELTVEEEAEHHT
jgi:RNA polymerase-binding transcription factor